MKGHFYAALRQIDRKYTNCIQLSDGSDKILASMTKEHYFARFAILLVAEPDGNR